MEFNLRISKRKRTKVLIFLFSISVILSCINPINSSISLSRFNKKKQFNDNLNDFKNLKINSNGPNAKPLLVYQHATISNTFLPLSLPKNVSFTLLEDWISKNVTIYYDGVSHKKDWVINGSFDIGENPWEYTTSKPAIISKNPWQPANVSIKVIKQQPLSKGDFGYFEENFSIPEIPSSNTIATLSMNYMYNIINPATPSPNISAFISINIGGIEKNISVSFSNLSIGLDYWHQISLTYDMSEVGQLIPENITIQAGVFVDDATSTAIKDQILYLDDIKFSLWTKPNQQNLIITKDIEFDQEYSYENITFGKGKTFIDVERSRTETSDIKFTISKNASYTEDLEIYNITITSEAVKIFNSTIDGQIGSTYVINNEINWQTECSFSIPYSYFNNWAEIYKPNDWNITSILDGYNVEKIGSCTGIEFGSTNMKIPQGQLSSGLWTFQASGQNYITKGSVFVWNGTFFNEQFNITYGETFHINATLNNTISLTNTQINCTIEYPNGTIFKKLQKEPLSNNVDFGNFTVGENMSVGTYQVSIIWTNNQSILSRDKVGFSQFLFNVWHHTNLTAINSYIERVSGEPLLIRVKYMDSDFNKYIDFATITYNSTFGTFGTMIYTGSGIYVIDVDTSGREAGNYYFSFNASKNYYENQSVRNLIQLKIINQPIALEVPHTIISAMANDYAICQINVTGAISGTLLPGDANITTNWINPYSVLGSNGNFELNFSTYNIPSQGIIEVFTITIFVNKTSYGSTSGFISLQVQPIATEVNLNQTIVNVLFNESFYLKVNYTDAGMGEIITGATLNVTWASSYVISPVADGFIVYFSTSNLSLDYYTIFFQLSHPGYQTAFESIYVIIEENPTYMEIYLNQVDRTADKTIVIQWNMALNITILYRDSLSNLFISGAIVNLNGSAISRVLDESGQRYYTIFSSGALSVGTHYLTVSVEKENYVFISEILTIRVDYVEISVGTMGFEASLDVYAGSTKLIKINLTEQNSGNLISTANILFSWKYDISEFENLGNGTYQIQLNIPSSASGSYNVKLIISVEGGYYKATESSFLLVVLQKQTPDNSYLIWVIAIVLLSVIGVFSALIARSYIFLPRKREKERLFLDKIQEFKDLKNIQGIMLIQKNSGMPFFTNNVSEFNFEENILISGFIQAITLFGEQSIIAESLKEKKKHIEKYAEHIIELNFKFFHLLICDYQCLRTLLILKDASSEKLKNQLYILTVEICSKFSEEIEDYKGKAIEFEDDIEILMNKFLFLFYNKPFKLNQGEVYIESMKKSRELESMESRVLNVIITLTKYNKEFTIDRIIQEIGEENTDLIYGGLHSLIDNKIIIPVDFKNNQSNS